jgi:CRP-like cAMP-binding protein
MIQMLKKISLFKDVAQGALEKLVHDFGVTRSFGAAESLMTPGDTEKDVFFLLEGKVRLSLLSPEGHLISYREIVPFDYFGWLSALDSRERLTAAVALEPVKVQIVKNERFKQFLLSDPHIFNNFMERMGGVLRRYTERIQELTLLSAQQRIIQEVARQFVDGKSSISLVSHADFATWIGTTRETVTRTLNELEKEGFIRKEGESYQLLKPIISDNDWLAG